MPSVHPHVRGEQALLEDLYLPDYGSSPRTWGTDHLDPQRRRQCRFIPTYVGNRTLSFFSAVQDQRFIPTYVGNSCRGSTASRGSSVHPHVRGEQAFTLLDQGANDGSSPRTWGTAAPFRPRKRRSRFIPTYVGNSYSKIGRIPVWPVHPHVRGEQSTMYPLNTTRIGSSPRTWGTDDRVPHGDGVRRFIPTYVGNRQNCRSWNTLRSGSSPRTWGTGRITFFAHPFVGFIPTYVGNRSVRAAWSCRDERFIPTYVGNRTSAECASAAPAVHPHVCGEQEPPVRAAPNTPGSSPRMWGTEPLHAAALSALRFIPTYVGNSLFPLLVALC